MRLPGLHVGVVAKLRTVHLDHVVLDCLGEHPFHDRFSLGRTPVWLSRGANTGVKYFVLSSQHFLMEGAAKGSSAIGAEFQLVEEESSDAKRLETRSGALYGLAPVTEVVRTPSETWIPVKLTCKAFACEHWLNGRRVLAFDLKSAEMQTRLREAAVSPSGSFGSTIGAAVMLRATSITRLRPGRISLQHHNTKVMFRDIQLRATE